MPVTVVVGAQWGDEGKAKVIDLLASEHAYVVRYQGGHNAGHTVVVGDRALRAATRAQRRALPACDPGDRQRCGRRHADAVQRDRHARGPGRQLRQAEGRAARRTSSSRGTRRSTRCTRQVRGDARIGTTLKGIGPAYADKARREGIRAGEVLDPGRLRRRGEGSRRQPQRRDRRAGRRSTGRRRARRAVLHPRRAALPRTSPTPCSCCTTRSTAATICCWRARRRRSSTSTTARIRSSPRPTRPRAGHVSAPGSGRATSTASSGSPRRTRPASEPGRSRPSCSTRSATSSSTSATSSARSPVVVDERAGSTA